MHEVELESNTYTFPEYMYLLGSGFTAMTQAVRCPNTLFIPWLLMMLWSENRNMNIPSRGRQLFNIPTASSLLRNPWINLSIKDRQTFIIIPNHVTLQYYSLTVGVYKQLFDIAILLYLDNRYGSSTAICTLHILVLN